MECKCSKEKEIATMSVEIDTLKEGHRDIREKIGDMDKIYKLIYEQTNSVSLLAQQMTLTTKDIGEIKEDLEIIKSKDGRKYEDTVSSVIKTLLTLVMGYMFSKLF